MTRDQYKKYLQASKVLSDIKGAAAWRLPGSRRYRRVGTHGGKRLICCGPLYKDAGANRLSDDRDQTVIQAK